MTLRRMLSLSLIVGAALALVASQASAALYVDLRFEDGSKEMLATADTDVQIQVWAQVTGSTAALDGLVYLYGAVQSVQVDGGLLAGGSGVGVTGVALHDAFNKAGAVQLGVASSLTADGIQDWGVPGTYTSCIKPANQGGASAPAYETTPGVVSNPITDGTEFLVATLTFHVGAVGTSGKTEVQWLKPNWTSPIAVKYQTSYPDGVSSVDNAHYAATNGSVTFIPEPATFGLLVLGGLAMLRPRRRR